MFCQQDGPAERVLTHLGDSSVTRAALEADPIEGLRQVIVIDQNGNIRHVFP